MGDLQCQVDTKVQPIREPRIELEKPNSGDRSRATVQNSLKHDEIRRTAPSRRYSGNGWEGVSEKPETDNDKSKSAQVEWPIDAYVDENFPIDGLHS